MVDGTALEMRRRGNLFGGSNPSLSAKKGAPHGTPFWRSRKDRDSKSLKCWQVGAGGSPEGAFARLRLQLPSGRELEVHLTHERLAHLQIAEGSRVYVRPNRVQVFPEDYSI